MVADRTVCASFLYDCLFKSHVQPSVLLRLVVCNSDACLSIIVHVV